MQPWLLSISIAYLLGSIPFGYLLVRFVRKQDIREIGSGNIGATNVARSGAKGLGLLTLLLDLGKAFLAVEIAKHIAPASFDIAVAAAIAAIVGHMFPVWLGFHGGKGVASGLGVFLALSWPPALIMFGIFLVIAFFSRYVSLAAMIAASTYPFLAYLFHHQQTPFTVFGTVIIPVLIILKHHGNIRRLLAGTESRFGSSPKASA
jgi:glycerol-3-phosphate acyltransferase PlsY